MSKRIQIDPITRIEGHLRIEVQEEGGRIANAWSSSTQFRGIGRPVAAVNGSV